MTTTTLSLDRLRGAAERVEQAFRALDDARHARDDVIKEVRRATDLTVDEIADAAGVSAATVRAVIRGITRRTN